MAPSQPLRSRQRMLTERTIREAALRLFVRQGSAATTVEQIAEAAGVSERTFFRYFRTKESAAVPGTGFFHRLLEEHAGGVGTVAEARDALLAILRELHQKQAGEELELLQLSFSLIISDPGIRDELGTREVEIEKDLFAAFSVGVPESEHFALRLMVNTVLAADRTVWIHWSHVGDGNLETLAGLHAQAVGLLGEIYGA